MHQIVQELKAIVMTPMRPRTAKSALHDPTVSRPSPQRSGEKEETSSESQWNGESTRSSSTRSSSGGGENGDVETYCTKQRDLVDELCPVREKFLDVQLPAKFICVVNKGRYTTDVNCSRTQDYCNPRNFR